MSELEIRPVNPDSDQEMNTIVAFAMMTIWETCLEARQQPGAVPNFTFESMKRNFVDVVRKPDRRFVVAVDEHGNICGHAIYRMSQDEHSTPYGYCHTRYVLPAFRRRGLAGRFLAQALDWFRERGASYALAHTHVANAPLLALFQRHGFRVTGRSTKVWSSVELRRDLER